LRPNLLSSEADARAAVRASLPRTHSPLFACSLLAALLGQLGCSHFILSKAADGLSSGTGGSFARDDDPAFVEAAIPFALKTMESLADQLPDHAPLRVSLASGFTGYAYAFIQEEADELDAQDAKRAAELRHRAKRMYLRARNHGLDGLQIARGITLADLHAGDDARRAALEKCETGDVALLYWTLVPWAAAIAADKRDLALVGDLPIIAAMLDRAIALDPDWQQGSLDEFSLAFDGARAGGTTPAAQKSHYDRALSLSQGLRVSLQVSWAENVLVAAQDKAAFEKRLNDALAFDTDEPKARELRLANLIAQRRARFLLAHEDDLIAGRAVPSGAFAAAGFGQVDLALLAAAR
jgi:hypothetical protein